MNRESLRAAVLAASVVAVAGIAAFAPVTAAPRPAPVATPAAPATRPEFVAPSDRFIVRFRSDAAERRNPVARQALLDSLSRRLGVKVSHGRALANGADLLRTARRLDKAAAKRLLVALRHDPRVEYVEVDRLHHPLITPTDPLWPKQAPYLAKGTGIGIDYAWERSLGSGAIVAVVDSGTTSHPDLSTHYQPGYDFITDVTTANDGNGRDADPADPGDWVAANECGSNFARNSSWHGTKVAGAIAAYHNNGIGGAGVAPQSTILPVRALGKCGGYTSDIADGIRWAAGLAVAGVPANANPADVINLSFTASGACSPTTQDAITAANAAGVVVLAAVGTNPAACTGVIGVTIADHWHSSPSPYADIAAPAGQPPFVDTWYEPFYAGITTTTNAGTTTPGAAAYTSFDLDDPSASMATAIASGVVAIMQAVHAQSPATVEALLRATAVSPRIECETPCESTVYPGLLDADAATLATQTPVLVANSGRQADETDSSRTFPVTVTLTQPLAIPVSFTAATTNGTALAGSDYTALAPTVFTIPAGQTSKVIDLTLLGDDVGELREDFWLDITKVNGAADLTDRVHVWINDDDARWLEPSPQPVFNPSWADRTPLLLENGTAQRFVFRAPAGATGVRVRVDWEFGGFGDPDLYVRAGAEPTVSTFDCASENPEAEGETCELGNVSGIFHILVDGVADDSAVVWVEWDTEPSSISISDAQVVEGNSGYSQLVFRIERTNAAEVHTMVDYDLEVVAGTATYFTDYSDCDSGPFVFAPGVSGHECVVYVNGDFDVEPNETLQVNLVNVVGATVADGSATGTIINDDGPTLSISADKGILEGSSHTFAVALSEAAAQDVTFDFATSNGTATAGSDYTAQSGSRTIPAGSLSTSFTITSLDDAVAEGDETVFVSLANATNATIRRDRAILELQNDDTFVNIGDATVTEGNSGVRTASLVVSLSQATQGPVSVDVRDGGSGTAAFGSDFEKFYQRVVIPAGMTSKLVTVLIHGDTKREADENFTVHLTNADSARLGDISGKVTILNDDPLPALSIGDMSINEGDSGTKLLTFTATLTNPSQSAITFSATSTNGTATAPSDFTAIALTGLSIPAGQLSKAFTVTVNGDTTVEPLEQFTVAIHSPTNASIADGQATGSIINNDGPTLSVSDGLVAEGNAGTKLMTFTVTLSQAAPTDVSYRIYTQDATAVAGSDYAAIDLSGQVIPAGQLSKQHTVTINGDATVEKNEAFTVQVRQPTGASVWDGYGTGQILNDDGPTLSVLDAGVIEGDSGTKTINVTVKLSQVAAVPVTYSIATSNGSATAGSDYTGFNLVNQVIPAGTLQNVHAITVTGDTTDENNETINVAVTNVSTGATVYDGGAIANIYNDDGPTLTVNDVILAEGQSGTKVATFTVTLSQVQGAPVTYNIATSNVTATAGSDYVANSLVGESIPAGQLSKTFAVTINGDTAFESDESFRVSLSNPTAGVSLLRAVGTGYINNDDAGP